MGDKPGSDKLDMRDYVLGVERELNQLLEKQRQVLLHYVEERQRAGLPIDHCGLFDCAPLERYRSAIQQAVTVLEDTRRSFKSRQLEELRKNLEAVLAENTRKF